MAISWREALGGLASSRVALALAAALASAACGDHSEGAHHGAAESESAAPAASGPPIYVEARTPSLPAYPCSRCHADRAPDPTERPLRDFHTRIDLAHGTAFGWCYRCHTKDDIDKLHLADGRLVSFDQAYELCGSCHGDKMRDWQDGIHGLTTGNWNGQKYKRSCTFCHSPHRPKFGSMTPERPPTRPRPRPEIRPIPQGTHEQANH